jgi:hypothetical protein
MNILPALVYLLCLATSLICTLLLARAYRRARTRLLLWSAVSFGFLSINNLLLVADLLMFPTVDLWVWRQAASLLAVCILLYGFIWEAE